MTVIRIFTLPTMLARISTISTTARGTSRTPAGLPVRRWMDLAALKAPWGPPSVMSIMTDFRLFSDRTINFNLGLIGFHYSGWGTKLVDFDNDGWLDLFITNGHTMEQLEKYFPADPFAEPNYVLRNIDGKKFVDVSAVSGLRNVPHKVGRGTAFGDFDNEGNAGVLVINKNDITTSWRNNG